MTTPVELEVPLPLIDITVQHPEGSPLQPEIDARIAMEVLLKNKRYKVTSRDHQQVISESEIADRLEYRLVDASGPVPIVLAAMPEGFQRIFVRPVDAQDVPGMPQSSHTTIEMFTSEGQRNIISKPYVSRDFVFSMNSEATTTPTTIASRQFNGNDQNPLDAEIALSVVCVDFLILDTQATDTNSSIGMLNLYPAS